MASRQEGGGEDLVPAPQTFLFGDLSAGPKNNLSKRAVDVGMLSTLRAITAKLGKVEQCSDHHCKGETRNDGETKTASYLVIRQSSATSPPLQELLQLVPLLVLLVRIGIRKW